MEYVTNFLKAHAEPQYAAFASSLMNDTIRVAGVRLPYLRKFARELVKNNLWKPLWEEEPDGLFETLLLKGLVMAEAKMTDEERWDYIERYVDQLTNWSLCDSVCTSLRFVRRNPEAAWKRLEPYWQSDREFAQRFAVVMLLDHFLTPEYKDRVLKVLISMRPEGYYARIAVAWALSMAFVSFPEQVYGLLQEELLPAEVQSMTLRKIVESRRVSASWKDRIRSLRR